MAAIPAPVYTETLRDFLHRHQVDAERLHFLLQQYTDQLFDTPLPLPVDMLSDPLREHRLWAYRKQLREFMELIEVKEESGNGDDENDDE